MLGVLSLVVALCAEVSAQNFNLSKFTTASGLPQNYVYSVVQDDNGFVWVGMAEGLSRYDGLRFTNYSVRDSLADNYVSKLFIDTDGYLWCGHGNGMFSYFDGLKFHRLPPVETMESPIKDMCLDDKGNIWAVEQNNGLVRISPDHKVTTYFDEEKFGSHVYTSVYAINSMALLVGTTDGLLSVKIDVDGTVHEPQEVSDIPPSSVNCITPTRQGNDLWVCTDGGGVYRYSHINGARQIERNSEFCTVTDDADYDIRSIYEDVEGNIYLGTWGNGLKEWKYRQEGGDYVESLSLDEENGLDNNFVADITVDREGIFWFATYGGGLVAWINNYFAQYELSGIGFIRNKVCSSQFDRGRLWLGLNDGIISMDAQCMTNFEYFDSSSGLPLGVEITSIVFDGKRHVQYAGTNGYGIYVKPAGENVYMRLEMGLMQKSLDIVNDMATDDSCLYVATEGGFVVYDIDNHMSDVYTTENKLPHNSINFVHIDSDGQVWVGPKDSGLAMLTEDGEFEVHRLANVPVDVAGMVVDKRGRYWVATVNNGVICTLGDSTVNITTNEGLEKNYCYGIAADANDHIWVCHQPGLSCIDLNNGNIRTYNQSNGITQEFRGVSVESNGDLWFTASNGGVHYIGAYDKRNGVAPIMNLTQVVISGKRQDLNADIDLPYPYGGDVAKLEFDFVGICMKDPRNVSYEYWLQRDGEDIRNEKWMPLGGQNHKEFDYLPDGDYVLNVRAFNSDGIVSQQPLKIPIHIDSPFWKSTWFPIVALALFVTFVHLFSQWRERRLMKRQQELEDEVKRQTKTLSEQKDEIERKNRDIQDSINYANRIQTAILPTANSFKALPFADTFIFFAPRDVVSGDFYWFNQFGNHVLICCGDCTGHGVPGAFMSMIGTTILNDATREEEFRHPAKLLAKMDKEVKQALNRNQTIETNDGMDCAIVDINTETWEVISAAAKRPIYFFIGGKLTTVSGTRRAIGEHRNDNEFKENVTQLQKGDCIYMCSDGFSDQLGCKDFYEIYKSQVLTKNISQEEFDAKVKEMYNDETPIDKYSTKRFKQLLEGMYKNDMYDQRDTIATELEGWRGGVNGHERVDDVIVMGIRL